MSSTSEGPKNNRQLRKGDISSHDDEKAMKSMEDRTREKRPRYGRSAFWSIEVRPLKTFIEVWRPAKALVIGA